MNNIRAEDGIAVPEASRPIPLTVMAENIPAELKQLNQWVVWRYEFKIEKQNWTKIPYQINGRKASTTDCSTWTNFGKALDRYRRGGVDGIGIVLIEDNGIVGIDLDHCFNPETFKCEQWAADIITNVDSYTEKSPSGMGVRIFVKATLPAWGRKHGNIEMYSSGRYLTITGNLLA